MTFLTEGLVDCSSLEGKRAISDVFDILDVIVAVGSSNRFVLQEVNDGGILLSTVYQRGAPVFFKPGLYMIGTLHSNCFFCSGSHCSPVPEEDGAEIFQRVSVVTFGSCEQAVPRAKKARVSDAVIVGSTRVRPFYIGSTDFLFIVGRGRRPSRL